MSEAARQIPEKEDSSSKPQTFTAKAYAAHSATSPLAPFTIARRSPRPQDVQIEILYCGVCHSDLHQVRNQWQSVMPTTYPCVPGHASDDLVAWDTGIGCRTRGQSRQSRQEIQGGRHRRSRLHGG